MTARVRKLQANCEVESEMDNKEEAMASSTALKAAKKELRSLMKQKLSAIPKESIDKQSNVALPNVKPPS